MNRIQTIIDKEWAEVFKNRIVLFTVAFLPLLFTALPLIILYATRSAPENMGDVTDLPPQFLEACGSIAPGECFQIFMVNQFMVLFMMMPLIIPSPSPRTASWARRRPGVLNRCWRRPSPPWNC